MSQWYYGAPDANRNATEPNEINGPYAKEDILYLISEGHLKTSDLVKHKSWDAWKLVQDVPESVWKEGEPAAPPDSPDAQSETAPSPESSSDSQGTTGGAPSESNGLQVSSPPVPPDPTQKIKKTAPPEKRTKPAQVFSSYQRNQARCPDCNKIVSLWATACPECGRPDPGSLYGPPNAPPERAFRASVYAWGTQLAVSALFIGGFLMSIPDTMPDERRGFVGVTIGLCVMLLVRIVLFVFYTHRSEIVRKLGIVISSISILLNALSFVRSLIALESGDKGSPSALIAKIMAVDWIPFETSTAVLSIAASLAFIILAINADAAFPRKDPVLRFLRGDKS